MGAQRSGFSSSWGCLEVTGGVTGRASSHTLALVFQTTSRCLHSPKSLGFPRTGAAHPQLQGHGFCVVRHCHLRSDPPTFPVVSSSASPNPSCICFIHSSTYSALPYVQRQHSRKRSIPGGRGAPRARYRDMRAPALHGHRSRPRKHCCGRDRGVSALTPQQGRQEKNRHHGGSPRCVRRGSVCWRKDQVGRGSRVPAQG